MAAEVLGRRVDHDVGTVLDRPAQRRGGEGVVHHTGQARLMAGRDQGRQVAHRDRGIRDGLQEQQPRAWPQRVGHLARIAPGDVADVDAVAGGQVGEDRERATVEAALGDDVIARAQRGQQHGVDRAHARAGGQRGRAAFEVGGRGLESLRGRIRIAAVGEPGGGIVQGPRAGGHVVEGEYRGLVDRDADRAGAVQVGGTGVDRAGLQVQGHDNDCARISPDKKARSSVINLTTRGGPHGPGTVHPRHTTARAIGTPHPSAPRTPGRPVRIVIYLFSRQYRALAW